MTSEEMVRDARARVADAVGDFANAYDRPGLVTGFVIVFELTEPSGNSTCWWLTGSGATPTDADPAGLPPHRVLGLLAYATRVVKRRIKR